MTPLPYVCIAGCQHRAKDGTVLGPRQVQGAELLAHDDRHVSAEARALVRMLREVPAPVRAEVLAYFADPLPRYAVSMERSDAV